MWIAILAFAYCQWAALKESIRECIESREVKSINDLLLILIVFYLLLLDLNNRIGRLEA